jgi:hypothetical protein
MQLRFNTGDLMSHNDKLPTHDDSERKTKYLFRPVSDTQLPRFYRDA